MYPTQLENDRKCLISFISTFGQVSILFTEMGLHRTRWFPPKIETDLDTFFPHSKVAY